MSFNLFRFEVNGLFIKGFASTIALGNATMPFMLALANKGWRQACEDDEHLLNGLNVHAGKLTYYAVGKALGLDVISPALALKQ